MGASDNAAPPPSGYKSAAVRSGQQQAGRLEVVEDTNSCKTEPRTQLGRINGPCAIGEHTTALIDRPSNRKQRLTECHLPTMTIQECFHGVGKSREVRYGKPFDRTKDTN